jgi:small GTP-binding protein
MEFQYKICIFGDKGVGKTTLVNHYLTNKFIDNIQATLGASVHVKDIEIENGTIKLQIWDFGGQKRFKFLISSYARGSAGGIFMFDLTNYETLIALKEWLPEFGKTVRYVPLIIVGGKSDLEEQRVIKREEVLSIMESYNFHKYVECSAKTGENVDLVFRVLVSKILEEKGYNYIQFK